MSGHGGRALANDQEQLQDACVPAITIRDVPSKTRDQLAERAAASGRSLQQYLRAELIRLAERADNVAIVTRAQDRVRQTSEGLTSDQILDLLGAGRAERE
jgi:plasmid stability protein